MAGFRPELTQSLRFRLLVGLSATIVVIGLIAAALSFAIAFHNASEVQNNLLRQAAALVSTGDLSKIDRATPWLVVGVDFEDRIIIRRLGPAANTQPLPDFRSTLAPGFHTVDMRDGSYRVLVQALPDGTRFAVAQQIAVRNEIAVWTALTAVLTIISVLLALLVVLGWILNRFFKPVDTMARALDVRNEADQSHLDATGMPAEFWPFFAAFNRLLTRIGKLLAAQRRFTAAAAHELRTPLASLSIRAERLAGDNEQYTVDKQSIRELRTSIERNQRVVDQLLSLSRSQAADQVVTDGGDVDEVLREIVADLMPSINDKHMDISVCSDQPVHVRVPRDELVSVLANVVSNAVAYTPVAGCVQISIARLGRFAVINVDDNGPGLSDQMKINATRAFYRGASGSQPGSGLGLTIVSEIVDKRSGRLALEDTPLFTSGLRVRIELLLLAVN